MALKRLLMPLLLVPCLVTLVSIARNYSHLLLNIYENFKENESKSTQHQLVNISKTQRGILTTGKVRRRSILIFGDDRSGTTYLTQLFSKDPNNFVVYEPLWMPKHWRKSSEEIFEKWERNVLDITSALLTCHFPRTHAASQFLAYTKKKWAAGLFHNPFVVPPFCQQENSINCPFLSPEFAEEMCSTKFKHSVVKVALVRTPEGKLSNLIPQIMNENSDTDIKVIHVVRDPRGSINSRINAYWIPDYNSNAFPSIVQDTCRKITNNVKFGKILPERIYTLVRYQDLAGTPLITAQRLYNFAGFEMSDVVKNWIVQSTKPNKEKLAKEVKKLHSTTRNSTANISKWRKESPIERSRIIQKECSELFDLLQLDRL